MSTVPNNSIPITSGSVNIIPSWTGNGGGITLSNSNSVTGTLSVNGSGNLVWSNGNSVHTFSKESLENVITEFRTGKYTRRYVEVYLEFMVLNALLNNLEYLEYKVSLDKELDK